jgi:hypothetical protein
VTAALAIVLILVGLPLLAWWVGRRRFWSRLRPGAEPDPWGDVVRTHRLSASEAPRVAHAVPRGAALDEPRLRAAAVDWARRLIEQETIRWPTSRTGRVFAGAAVVWLLCVIGLLLHRVLTGRPEDVNWTTVIIYAGVLLWFRRRRRLLRRAVELNQDEPATA